VILTMNSLDTNILIYASNQDAPEHLKAQKLVGELLAVPSEWIIADQVLIEFYRALRNPAVFERPASAPEAWEIVKFYREEAGCQRCCFELQMWLPLEPHLKSRHFEAKRTFDAVLAITLISNTVDVFYTRNAKDFKGFGFRSVVNPID
jgi:toxin-antitoxin system PIN domain toxin